MLFDIFFRLAVVNIAPPYADAAFDITYTRCHVVDMPRRC